MFKKYEFNTDDLEKMSMGYLPDEKHIMTIIPSSSFYAVFEGKGGEEEYDLLVAWAFLRNGAVMPLVYDSQFNMCRCPEKMEGFLRLDQWADEDDDVEEEGVDWTKFIY